MFASFANINVTYKKLYCSSKINILLIFQNRLGDRFLLQLEAVASIGRLRSHHDVRLRPANENPAGHCGLGQGCPGGGGQGQCIFFLQK